MDKSYRKNVAAIVLNNSGNILLCERSDIPNAWQVPQGGIDEGEGVEEALLRELEEEIGNKDVEIIDRLPYTIKYDWPEELHRNGYCGQEQIYFLVSLKDENKIDLEANDEHQEFVSFEWVSLEVFFERVSSFKKDAYKKAMSDFLERNPEKIR